jgi:hypothetical protein
MSAAANPSSRVFRGLAVAIGLCGIIASSAARAEPVPPAARTSLGWTRLPGAEVCTSARDLALDVEARLGHATFVAPSGAELQVEGHVEVARAPSAFRATVRMVDREGMTLGTRELETGDPTCRDLADPLGLAVALMIDPEAASVDAPAAAPALRSPAAAPFVDAPRLDEPGGVEPKPEAPHPWRFQVDGGVTSAVGLLPRAAVGGRLRLLLDPVGFPGVQIAGAHFPEVAGAALYEVSYAGLGLCPLTPDLEVLRLVACAGVSVGAFRATATLGGRTDPFAQPFGSAGVVRRIVGPVVGTLDAALLVPINPHVYAYGPGFHMSPVAGTLDLGLGIEVP